MKVYFTVTDGESNVSSNVIVPLEGNKLSAWDVKTLVENSINQIGKNSG